MDNLKLKDLQEVCEKYNLNTYEKIRRETTKEKETTNSFDF